MNIPANPDSLRERRLAFKQLHLSDGIFVMPNPWDVGTAKLLSSMNFRALATTSAGYAFSQGKQDNHISREEMFDHIGELVAATALPFNADLENGYGDDPTTVAETIKMALDVGLAGASIEDMRPKPDGSIYPLELAAERIQAASEAAQSDQTHFVLTARAENYLCGHPDLNDTIKRLQAFQEAGADVLYAPGLTQEADIRAVVSSVDKPVNIVMGLAGAEFSLQQLATMGVTRISLGSAFTRLAFGAIKTAATEILETGSFDFSKQAMPFADINTMMKQ